MGSRSMRADSAKLLFSGKVNFFYGYKRVETPGFHQSAATVMGDCLKQTPLFTFGIIADIQYADIDDGYNFERTRRRYYRNSLQLLRNALDSWSKASVKPGFILQLGDIIDGFNKPRGASERALDTVLEAFGSSPAGVHHVWGNHEFYNFSRSRLLQSKLNSTPHADRCLSESGPGSQVYAYHFSPYPGFTFVVLDAYDVSVLGREESSQQYRDAFTLLKRHNTNEDLNCPPGEGLLNRFTMFNGGLSKEQLNWLDSVLSSTDEKQEKVTIVCHLPVHPGSTPPMCLVWNFSKVLDIISAHRSVVCFLAGHEHDGRYYLDKDTGVHHVTFEAVIETPPDSNAFGIVYVFKDRMVLKGSGRVADRVLHFPGCQGDDQSDHQAD